jgi:hypothetical protein
MPSGEMHSPSLSPVNTKRAHSCSPPSGPPSLVPTPRTARRGCEDEAAHEGLEVHDWVRTVLTFLEKNGQELLQAICTRYKIPYDRTITSIPIGTWEQVRGRAAALQLAAYCFPALPPRRGRAAGQHEHPTVPADLRAARRMCARATAALSTHSSPWAWRARALAQVAYNAIFNPALPKNASGDGMPLMLRNVKGVSDFQLRFLQDKEGIFKTTYVYARLSGIPFEMECRSCSYCGSCFSGRFMELDSTHQRAGGWKEITEKIHAGNFSWKGLKG